MSINTNIGTLSNAATADSPYVQLTGIIANTKSALDGIVNELETINTKSALIRYGVPVDSTVFKGALVYYDSSSSKYKPAYASILSTRQTNGASVEGPESHVEGIIIDMNTTTYTATMLTGGMYTDTAVMAACLGSVDKAAGVYYLTPDSTNPGKAVAVASTYGKLQQGILSYYGAGAFSLSLFYMAHDNHFHGSAELTAARWVAASTALPSGYTSSDDVPTGYSMWYNPDKLISGVADLQFKTAGQPTLQATSIFYDGKLQKLNSTLTADTFGIYDNIIWYKGTTAPTATVVMYNHYGFAYGSPLIHSVTADESSALTIDNNNGDVVVSRAAYELSTPTASASAVSSISGNILSMTPIVSSIAAGAGITAVYGVSGDVILSSNNMMGTPQEAYSVLNRGTTVTSDGMYQFITFPKGRTASVIITMPVTAVSETSTMSACCWGCLYGTTAATFNVVMQYVKLSTVAGSVTLPTSSEQKSTSLAFSGAASGTVEYAYTNSVLSMQGSGLLVASVTINAAPTVNDVRLLRLGFKVNTTAVQSTSTITTQAVEYVKSTFIAAEEISAGDAVYMTENGIKTCTAASATMMNRCVGIAMNSAAASGSVICAVSGAVTDSDIFNFTEGVGLPLYISTTGTLTTTVPTAAAYTQQVGTVLATNTVLLSIRQAVETPAN